VAPTVRPLSTDPIGSASRTRSSAPAVPTTASAARAAGNPVPRSVGGCSGPATTAGALLLVDGVDVGCPARYGALPGGGETSGCTGGGDAVGVVAGGVGRCAAGGGAVEGWFAGEEDGGGAGEDE